MAAGQDPAALEHLAPREVQIIIHGAILGDRRRAWMIGDYVRHAMHGDPSAYPAAPELPDLAPQDGTIAAEIAAIRRRVILTQDNQKAGGRNGG